MSDNYSTTYRPHQSKAKVTEDTARTANSSYSYTGTVRTVGSGKAYSTLTAAYTAAASGDIIEVYGTIDLTLESGGYWLINTAKSVLVRGSTSTASDTVLSKTGGASTFAVRVRVNSGIVFKDLTISTDQNSYLIYNDADEANRNMICDNVRFIHSGTGTSAVFLSAAGVNTTQTRYFEYKNCFFQKLVGTNIPFNIELPSANNTFLFTGCSWDISGASPVRFYNGYNGTVIFYDNNFRQRSANEIVQFGSNTTIPAATLGLVDFRGNVLKFDYGVNQHGILIGRGTDNVKCYNNEVYMYPSSNSNAIGVVIKSTASSVGNSLIKGNFAYAPRPFYIKGGSSTVISNNIGVTNYVDGNIREALGFTNHKSGADEVLSRSNVITNNYFISKDHGIHVYNTGAAETDIDSFKTCTLYGNKYATSADRYLYTDSGTAYYTFSNKNSFWGNPDNDYGYTKINNFICEYFV